MNADPVRGAETGLGAATVVMLSVTAADTLGPARSAARSDPTIVLRTD